MTELNLVQVDNDSLKNEYHYFFDISKKPKTIHARKSYMNDLQKIFEASD